MGTLLNWREHSDDLSEGQQTPTCKNPGAYMVHCVFPVKDDFEQKMSVEGGKHLLWQHDTALERLENNALAFGHRPLLL